MSGGAYRLLSDAALRAYAVTSVSTEDAIAVKAARVTRRGGNSALAAMAQRFGDGLWQQLPVLWSSLSAPFTAALQQSQAGSLGPESGMTPALLNALQVVQVRGKEKSGDVGTCEMNAFWQYEGLHDSMNAF